MLIRIGYVAHGFAEQERGAPTEETEIAVAFEEALQVGGARGVNRAEFPRQRRLGGCQRWPVSGPGETYDVGEGPSRIAA